MEFITLKTIYYGSYISIPLILFFIYKRYFILIILFSLFIYMRFIEPQIIVVNEHTIKTGFKARYALIADLHLGVYNDEKILIRVIEKVNNLNVDALLIAGDLLYQAEMKDIERMYLPLKKVNVPVYVVFGNHDYQNYQLKERDKLENLFNKLKIHVITNKVEKLNDINIVGLGSYWFKDDNVKILNQFKESDPVLILTHNPDTTYSIKRKKFMLLAGHTHGGQIRIPYLYKKIIPVKGDILWDKGLYKYKKGQVFVTSGIGEIGLPLRFLVPPVIDILNFK